MQDAQKITRDDRRDRCIRACLRAQTRLGLVAVLAFLMSVCAAALGESTRPGGTVTSSGDASPGDIAVRMFATAVVPGDDIRLSDVAELVGHDAESVAGWTIARSPAPGGSKQLSLTQLERALSRRNVNLACWVFRGSSQCTVTRPVQNARDPMAPAVPGATSRPATPATEAASVDAASLNPDSLEAELRGLIAGRVANIGGVVSVQFPRSQMRLLALSRPTYSFRIVERDDHLLGHVPFEVTIYEQKHVRQVLQVVAEVSVRKPVIVARRTLNRGEIVGSADLGLEERSFDRLEDIGLTEAASLIGQRIQRLVQRGSMIQSRDMAAVPLVERNDLVTVWVRKEGLVVKGTARALGSGGYGDLIDVRNERSRERFTGVVVGPRTVEVTWNAGTAVGQPYLANAKERS